MKKILALLMATLLIVGCMVGCSPKGITLDEVKENGKLVVATSPDFPPFESLDENGDVVGIEIEIMDLICKELGVELEIKDMNFDSVLPGVQTGKFDVGVSGISVTPEREKNVLFTDAYCLAAQSIVVVEGSPITNKADLKDKSIAVQTGTTAQDFCLENNYDVKGFKGNAQAQTALLSDKVAAWVIDDLTAKEMVDTYNAGNPEKKLVILDEAMTTEPYAFAFAFGSEDLVEEINKILADLIADGTVASIFEKYNAPYTSPEEAE